MSEQPAPSGEQLQQVCELILAGADVETAVRGAGIELAAHDEWMARGEQAKPPSALARLSRRKLEELLVKRGSPVPSAGSGRGGSVVKADLLGLLERSDEDSAYRRAIDGACAVAEWNKRRSVRLVRGVCSPPTLEP